MSRHASHSSQGLPRFLIDLGLSSYLSLTLLFATSLSYFWFGRIPMWFLLTIIGYVGLFFSHAGQVALRTSIQLLLKPIIIPWLAFCMVILMRDAIGGSLRGSFTDRFGLNIASLSMLLLFVSAARLVNPRLFVLCVALVFALPGFVAVAQFSGSHAAWQLPDRISAKSSRDMAYYQTVLRGQTAEDVNRGFERMGRARGLHIFIHKFGVIQGVGATFILGLAAMSFGRRSFGVWHQPILICGLIALAGTVVSYSRSAWLGLMVALAVFLFYSFKGGRIWVVFGVFAVAACSAIGALLLGVLEFEGARRLFYFDIQNINDYSRIASMRHSISQFASNPLFGVGTGADNAGLPTHNLPLRILGDFGILGFVFYAWVWLGIFSLVRGGLRHPLGLVHITAVAFLAALALIGVDMMTHSSGLLHRGAAQSALIGVMLGVMLLSRGRDSHSQRRHG